MTQVRVWGVLMEERQLLAAEVRPCMGDGGGGESVGVGQRLAAEVCGGRGGGSICGGGAALGSTTMSSQRVHSRSSHALASSPHALPSVVFMLPPFPLPPPFPQQCSLPPFPSPLTVTPFPNRARAAAAKATAAVKRLLTLGGGRMVGPDYGDDDDEDAAAGGSGINAAAAAPAAGSGDPSRQGGSDGRSLQLRLPSSSGVNKGVMVLSNSNLDAAGVAALKRRWGSAPIRYSWVFDSVSLGGGGGVLLRRPYEQD